MVGAIFGACYLWAYDTKSEVSDYSFKKATSKNFLLAELEWIKFKSGHKIGTL